MPRSRRTQTSTKPDEIAWQTESLRVTAFPIAGATVVPNPWKEITGNDPAEIVKQPSPMQSFEAGPFSTGRLSVGYQPGRIELVLMPLLPLAPDQINLSAEQLRQRHIGDFDLAMDNVLLTARKMFRPDMVMQRLAVGAVLLDYVESPEDAYKVLRSILPIAREIPETARDFNCQLNVPIPLRVTGISDININRLLRWNAGRLQMLGLVGGSGIPTQIVGGGEEIYVVRVEMDINTPADLPVALSHQNIVEVMDLLAAQARAIAAKGGWFPE
jgi:hypothetical protein